MKVMTSMALKSLIPVAALAIELCWAGLPAAAQAVIMPGASYEGAVDAMSGPGPGPLDDADVPPEGIGLGPVDDADAPPDGDDMTVARPMPEMPAPTALAPPPDAPAADAASATTPAAATAPAAQAVDTVQAPPPATADAPRDGLPAAIAAFLNANAGVGTDGRRRMAAVAGFYRARSDAPLWIEDGRFSDKARAVIARIAAADEDGLNPSEFALPDPDFRLAATGQADAAANEVGLSLAIVAFAEQASGGLVQPSSIYKDITRTPERIAGDKALAEVAAADDVDAALESFNPPHEAFRRLKAKLAEIRAAAAGSAPPPPPVRTAKTLKPGMSDVGVPALRQRLGLPPETDRSRVLVYDDALVAAVEMFQAAHHLAPDGIVGNRTMSVLNLASRDVEGEILANMEMWRWMPRDLSRDYVFVNVPEFVVRVYRHGAKVHEARVVVGKTDHQTPIFSGEMQYLVINPYWNVPESIKIKEMLPAIQADPAGYFARHGYEATWQGQVIDPSRIVWNENAVKAVGIRQVPGEANALGHIKFMFPNKHAVYLHDTPLRSLFARSVRAFSHGCVRVDDPMSFAAAVLEGDPNWTVGKLEAMFGGPEKRVDIATRLKVHIAYFTARVDGDGELELFDDVYGYARSIKATLARSDI